MQRIQRGELVAKAIRRAVREHGAPNTFSPGELTAYYGATVSPLEIGLSAWDAMLRLRDAGYTIDYRERRFHVDAVPECDA